MEKLLQPFHSLGIKVDAKYRSIVFDNNSYVNNRDRVECSIRDVFNKVPSLPFSSQQNVRLGMSDYQVDVTHDPLDDVIYHGSGAHESLDAVKHHDAFVKIGPLANVRPFGSSEC